MCVCVCVCGCVCVINRHKLMRGRIGHYSYLVSHTRHDLTYIPLYSHTYTIIHSHIHHYTLTHTGTQSYSHTYTIILSQIHHHTLTHTPSYSHTQEKEKTYNKKPKTIKTMVRGTYISIITLNVSVLNAPARRCRLAEWIQKRDPNI